MFEGKAHDKLEFNIEYCMVLIGLKFILQSLEEQFKHENGYNIARCIGFKFLDDEISAVVPKQDSRYTIGFQPANANVSDAHG